MFLPSSNPGTKEKNTQGSETLSAPRRTILAAKTVWVMCILLTIFRISLSEENCFHLFRKFKIPIESQENYFEVKLANLVVSKVKISREQGVAYLWTSILDGVGAVKLWGGNPFSRKIKTRKLGRQFAQKGIIVSIVLIECVQHVTFLGASKLSRNATKWNFDFFDNFPLAWAQKKLEFQVPTSNLLASFCGKKTWIRGGIKIELKSV